jgi:splicing factor 3B subunit 3
MVENRLVLLHKTDCDDVPYALAEFQGTPACSLLICSRGHLDSLSLLMHRRRHCVLSTGRLLAGVGRSLRLYDIGKKKLLKKADNRSFPNTIVKIHTMYHVISLVALVCYTSINSPVHARVHVTGP